jgi:hypothetical protein
VTYEASYTVERGGRGRTRDPWLQMIPCRHGHIYPHGGEYLAASTNHRGSIAKRLAASIGVRISQDGDDGINAVFHEMDFDTVAAILKPKRRRRLTPAQIAQRIERLRKYQFSTAGQNVGADRLSIHPPESLPRAA